MALLVAVLAIGVLVVLFLCDVQLPLRRTLAPTPVRSSQPQYRQADPDLLSWSDASRVSLRVNRVMVGIPQVTCGEVRGKDSSNRVVVSETKDHLVIRLKIQNLNAQSVLYRSWYGQAFDDRGTSRFARLSDDDGRSYEMVTFSDIRSIKGHVDEQLLASLQEATDVIIFRIPQDLDRSTVDHLFLELPAIACGGDGFYRFRIPRSMIEGF